MSMFGSSLAAALHFTLEFAGFVVAMGAAVLVATRSALIPGRPIGRMTAAAGFVLLAIAGVLHGAGFVTADAESSLVALRTVGWLFIGLAVVSATPLGASGVLASGEPLLFSSAGAAVFTALAAAVRARSHPALYRLAAAGAVTGAGEALIAVAPATAVDAQSVGVLFFAAHALRLVGYLTLAAWLWTVIRTSVRSRFVAAFALLLVVVVLALSTSLTVVISNNIEREGLARVRTQLAGAIDDIKQQETELGAVVEAIASSNAVRRALEVGSLSDVARGLAANEVLGVDFVGFEAARGQGVLVGDGPALGGSNATTLDPTRQVAILDSAVVGDVRSGGRPSASVEALADNSITILAAAEIEDKGRRVGIAITGRYLDSSSVEIISARVEPARASLFSGRRVVASELDDPPPVPGFVPDMQDDSLVSRRQSFGERQYFTAFGALPSRAGEVTIALSAPSEVISDTSRDLTRAMFLSALAVGVIALLLAWLSGRRITQPIQSLTATAHAVAGGDLSARATVTGDDEVGQLGATFNDMTSSLVKMTEEEQALRSRIETIIQSMADGLVAVDAERRVLAFNVEAELLTGVGADQALGRPVDEVLDVRDGRGQSVKLPINSLSEGAVAGVYMARRFGAPVPVAITSAVLRDENNELAGAVAVIRDMSREHELEKLKGEFLSNISHELRTPLTPIKGYAEILSRSGLSEQKSIQFARGILDSTQKLERIVALLVDYSSLEAGKLTPRTSSVDIASIVESLAQEWTRRAPRHQIEMEIGPDLPRASGDERLLRRTLEEVLDNAVKFSPTGGEVRLEARRGANGRDGSTMIDVSVTDDGIGIQPEDLPTIFSDFHQLDSSETRTFGGLGLGLAFVQRIVQAHQGHVSVDSQPNRGTRLTISIPAVGDGSAPA